jgi:phage terminase Nu1 subunit (DNA packaging protein)
MKKVTGTALAAHLFCTRETVSDYEARGIVRKLPDGGYDQDQCREQVLEHLRDKAAGRKGADREPGAPDPNVEKALLARSQKRKIDLDIAQREGRVVDIEIVGRELELENRIVTEKLLTIEVIADALEPLDVVKREACRAAIHDKVIEVLNELSAPAALIDRAAGSAGGDRPSAARLSSATESQHHRRQLPPRRRRG